MAERSLQLSEMILSAVNEATPRLRALPAPGRSTSGRWTAKQELGHLVDSAANNHQRIVRAALYGDYRGPGYEQDAWVELGGYADSDWQDLVDFWNAFNRRIAAVVANVPDAALAVPCTVADYPPMTLDALIVDYHRHLRHHLDQIFV